MYSGFLAALTIALLLTVMAGFEFKRRGRHGVFSRTFSVTWVLSLYVRAVDPVFGISPGHHYFWRNYAFCFIIAVMPDAKDLRDEALPHATSNQTPFRLLQSGISFLSVSSSYRHATPLD